MSGSVELYGVASSRELDDLRSEVDGLRRSQEYAAEELRDEMRRIDQTAEVAELTEQYDALSGKIHNLEETAEDLDGRIDELEHTLSKVRRETQWLTRHARAGDDPVTADLDALVRSVAAQARTAVAGKRAEATFLDDDALWRINHRITAWDTWCNQWRAAVETMLAATDALTRDLPDDDAARGSVLTTYTRAARTVRELAAREESTRRAAEKATAQLDADESNRARLREVVDAGRKADGQVRTRIRTAIHEAAAQFALFPAWFSADLGPLPGNDTARWVALGTDLVAYRATYDVTDLIDGLGSAPADDWPTDRADWYADLRRNLQAYS